MNADAIRERPGMWVGYLDDRGLVWLVGAFVDSLLNAATETRGHRLAIHRPGEDSWEIATDLVLPEASADDLADALAARRTALPPNAWRCVDETWLVLTTLSRHWKLEIRDGQRLGRVNSDGLKECSPCGEPAGFCIRFTPDPTIFPGLEAPRLAPLRRYLDVAAAFHPGLTATLMGDEPPYRHPNGICDFFESGFGAPPRGTVSGAAPGIRTEIAWDDRGTGSLQTRSFVNRQPVDFVGTLARGFWQGWGGRAENIRMIAFLFMNAPRSHGPANDRIDNPELRPFLRHLLIERALNPLSPRGTRKQGRGGRSEASWGSARGKAGGVQAT